MNLDERKVVVGMSGGVDSSVAAYLLKQQGYEVIGVMLKLWSEAPLPGQPMRDNACCSLKSVNDARAVAAAVGVPFYLLDATKEFYEKVVMPFVEAYLIGDTPNPCAKCNPEVRWRFLLNYADLIGAKYVATGHYARLKQDADGKVTLSRGRDAKKDQSYILSRLPLAALERSLFPLGEMTKTEVRELAKNAAIPSFEKRESQDICFIADGDYRGFLTRCAGNRIQSGSFVDSNGNVVGKHDGIPFYTIGQRKGIRLSTPTPKYVLRKNATDGTILVGEGDESLAAVIRLTDVNRLKPVEGDESIWIQTRYKSTPCLGRVENEADGSVMVRFNEPQRQIASGQVCVLYGNSNEVILSGTINLINL